MILDDSKIKSRDENIKTGTGSAFAQLNTLINPLELAKMQCTKGDF